MSVPEGWCPEMDSAVDTICILLKCALNGSAHVSLSLCCRSAMDNSLAMEYFRRPLVPE